MSLALALAIAAALGAVVLLALALRPSPSPMSGRLDRIKARALDKRESRIAARNRPGVN